MSLLAPLFLLGALAIAGPLVAHLVRRATRERVAFSATRFLDPSPPRLDRRNRVQHPMLLILRCLALAALVLAFARPFFREDTPPAGDAGAGRHVVIVLDESASMQRRGLWPAALERVSATAAGLRADDRLAILVAGRSTSRLLTAEAWAAAPPATRPALLDAALDGRTPGWETAHLDTAIDVALEELSAMAESGPPPASARVLVVSDFAEGARIAGLAGREWPPGAALDLAALPPPATPNAALHWLGWTTDDDGAPTARLRLTHDAAASRDYRITLHAAGPDTSAGALGEPQVLTLAPHETRALTVALPAGHRAPARAVLEGDGEPFDNTVWLVPPEQRTHPLPYLGTGDAGDPARAAFYLARATVGWRDPAMTLQPVAGNEPWPDGPLLVVGTTPGTGAIPRLRERLEAGATVLVLATEPAAIAAAGALAEESGWSAHASTRPDALLADIRFRHPLFAPFADPRFSDFTRIRFWRWPVVQLPETTRAEVVARFDDGSPAVIECAAGRGTLVVWAGDWTPSASQWVLSSKFVPWLQSLARRASGGPAPPAMAEVGEVAVLPAASAELPRTPGIHTLATASGPRVIALNVPAGQSRAATIPLDAWEALGVPLAAADGVADTRAAVAPGSLAATRIEAGQQLWRWLLLATAAVLALESLLARRLATRGAPAT